MINNSHTKKSDVKTMKRSSVLALLLACTLLLAACGSTDASASAHCAVPLFPPLPEPEGLRIAVASDLHLNPENRPVSDERSASSYSLELVDALLRDVQNQNADILLLTGDLCNSGKKHNHAALTGKLKQAEQSGLTVCVLPGNHDLAPVTQTGFAELYSEFGYAEAHSRDESSLSYCAVRDDLMILMMDTAGYSIGSVDLPGAVTADSQNPHFSEGTIRWVEGMLKEAKAHNMRILAAGHYNLLPEISRDPDNARYYLVNGDLFSDLLKEYGVPLYLSGHIHTRAVYQEEGLTELVTEYLLSYPTGYSILDLTDEGITYTPCRVDVDSWAAETGSSDPVLLSFTQWQQDELQRYSVSNVEYMSERNPLSSKEKKQAAEFFYEVMNAYWKGTLSKDRGALKTMPGYSPFFRCSEGYAYGWWLKDLIDTASPLLEGFRISW